MSTRLMAQVWDLEMDPSAKAVLISLADQANDDGVCWPGIGTIAKRTCLCDRAVQTAIARLESEGHLTRDLRPLRSSLYRLHPGKVVTQGGGAHAAGGAPDAPGGGAPDAPPPRTTCTLNRKRTVEKEGGEVRRAVAHRLPQDWTPRKEDLTGIKSRRSWLDVEHEVSQFRDYWASAAGANARKLDWDAAFRVWCGRQQAPRGVKVGTDMEDLMRGMK